MLMRIYIHAPDLPNSRRSSMFIESRLRASDINAEIVINKANPAYFEYTTLHRMWKDAKHGNFYALYLHLKGSSKTDSQELENARCWMDYMLFGVVDNWRLCRQHLDAGSDLVGSQWHWHFKGNFWWAKSSYLRNLPDPLSLSGSRFAAEYWCCWGLWKPGFPKPAVKNLFYVEGLTSDHLYANAHAVNYPPDIGRKAVFTDKQVDNRHGESISQFLERGYLCAFDIIYIPTSQVHLLTRLAPFLNYDGHVSVGENMYDTVKKPWKEIS